jgi:hypothetical protein
VIGTDFLIYVHIPVASLKNVTEGEEVLDVLFIEIEGFLMYTYYGSTRQI